MSIDNSWLCYRCGGRHSYRASRCPGPRALLAALLILACAPTPAPEIPPQCEVPDGIYHVELYRRPSQDVGACEWLDARYRVRVEFKDGAFINPIPFAECAAAPAEECAQQITCTVGSARAVVTFTAGASGGAGELIATGSAGGCRRVVYALEFLR